MTDDVVVDHSVEEEARTMGWVPKEEFRGDVARWVDAESFVEHGRHVMPILRRNNERLLSEQMNLRQEVRQLRDELGAAREDFKTLEEFHNEEVTRRVEETRKQLKAQIKLAREEGDVDSEIDLTGQLGDLNAANRAAEESLDAGAGRPNGKDIVDDPTKDPDYIAWATANPWFLADQVKGYSAMAVAAAITKERPDLRKKAFFDELDRRLAGESGRPAASKVEGSKGGTTRGSGNGRTYTDLPAEAKAQCDKFAKKFVNPKGTYKTEAEYRKHFIQNLEQTGYFTE